MVNPVIDRGAWNPGLAPSGSRRWGFRCGSVTVREGESYVCCAVEGSGGAVLVVAGSVVVDRGLGGGYIAVDKPVLPRLRESRSGSGPLDGTVVARRLSTPIEPLLAAPANQRARTAHARGERDGESTAGESVPFALLGLFCLPLSSRVFLFLSFSDTPLFTMQRDRLAAYRVRFIPLVPIHALG